VRRKDDEPAAVRQRMRAYREQTEPVVAWYEGRAKKANGPRVVRVNAVGDIDDITNTVMRELKG
jgi:adenylate kinase